MNHPIHIDQLAYGDHVLACGINLPLEQGSVTLLCGPNGSGKTTLLRRIAAMERSAVLIPTGIPKLRGFSLEAFVRTSCYRESSWSGRLSAEAERRMEAALSTLGLEQLRSRDIATLSDGEFQKACIATALIRRGKILLLDEPTAFLDPENRMVVLRTLREVAAREQVAVLFSSHDLHEASLLSSRIAVLTRDGRFLFSGADEGSRREVLSEAFPSL